MNYLPIESFIHLFNIITTETEPPTMVMIQHNPVISLLLINSPA